MKKKKKKKRFVQTVRLLSRMLTYKLYDCYEMNSFPSVRIYMIVGSEVRDPDGKRTDTEPLVFEVVQVYNHFLAE